MKKKVLDKRAIAAYRRRQHMMMLADNGGERPTPPEPAYNMRVVAHPDEGYSMPTSTGNFRLVEQRDDVYYYQHNGSSSIGNSMFSVLHNYGITDVTFKDCEHITSIGNYFLSGNSSLTSINLSSLSNVTSIDSWFLSGCTSLTQIDLSILSNVTSVGAGFLYYCRNLTQIDLSLPNVTSVGGNFLSGCTKLVSIKLPWVTIPTTTTDGFMANAPTTCSIEVPCEALSTYKTTSPWSSRADYINGGEGCEEPEPAYNMKVVAHPDEGYSMPTATGNFTLVEQDGDTYYYSLNDGVTSTGDNVLYDADNGAYWGVESVEFKNCEHITSIDNRFFNECSTLVSIDLSALSNVTTIDGNFLRKCSSLPSVDLSALSNVTTIQQSFLNGCLTMTTIDLSPLISCTYFNSYFLYNCTNLATLILPWATEIPQISATGFMSSVPKTCSIEVPCEAVDTYNVAPTWRLKKSQIIGDC